MNYKSLHISEEDFARLTSDDVVPIQINPLSIKRFAAKAYRVFGFDPSEDKAARTLGRQQRERTIAAVPASEKSVSTQLPPQRWKAAQQPAAGGRAGTSSPSLSVSPASSLGSSATATTPITDDEDDDDGSDLDRDRRSRISRMLPDLMIEPDRGRVPLLSAAGGRMSRQSTTRFCLDLDDGTAPHQQIAPTSVAAAQRRGSRRTSGSSIAFLDDTAVPSTSGIVTRPRHTTPAVPPLLPTVPTAPSSSSSSSSTATTQPPRSHNPGLSMRLASAPVSQLMASGRIEPDLPVLDVAGPERSQQSQRSVHELQQQPALRPVSQPAPRLRHNAWDILGSEIDDTVYLSPSLSPH